MATTLCLSCLQQIDANVCPHCGYPLKTRNSAHHLPVGTMLRGRYQLGQVLGQGGFGITYLALDTLMKTTVAVKEFYPTGTVFRNCTETTWVKCVTEEVVPHYEYSRARFLREANALVKFKDIPEIVDILDFVEENNTAYIVMEFIRGMDLAKYVKNHGGKLTVEETFRILKPVIEALATVHKGGIIHRDISPDNIVLDPLGGAKLLDFGAVRTVENPDLEQGLEKSTEAIIKRGFAPIEQYNTRGSLGPWTDLYALCATIWYCLTGDVPPEATVRISEGSAMDWSAIPGLSLRQQQALIRGSALVAKERYPDLDSFLEDLFGKGEPQKAAPAKPRKRKPLLLAAVLALVIAGGLLLFSRFAPPKEQEPADLYRRAQELKAQGAFLEAAGAFEDLGYYEDSPQQAQFCRYAYADSLLAQSRYEEALAVYETLDGYKDSEEKITQCRNALTYAEATALMEQGSYAEAAESFASLGSYLDSEEKADLCATTHAYLQAQALLEAGRYFEAATGFYALGDFRDSREQSFAAWRHITPCLNAQLSTIEAGQYHSVALREDGTVVAASNARWSEYGQCDLTEWQDIIAVAASNIYTLGLRADGTVLALGDNLFSQCNLTYWDDLVAISAGEIHSMGLRSDGTVVAVGSCRSDQLAVGNWRDIVAISAGYHHSVGLKADGTVVFCGRHYPDPEGLASWRDIIAISAGRSFTLGLKADGTVALSSDSYQGIYVYEWRDIVAISAGSDHAVGLRADGTVVYTGANTYGEGDVGHWTDIVAVHAGDSFTLGLRADGTVVAAGRNTERQCEVSGWTQIRQPAYQP